MTRRPKRKGCTSRGLALKERFWETYYGEDEAAFTELALELESLDRALLKAEKAMKKARAGFERNDFDEAPESLARRTKADATKDEGRTPDRSTHGSA